MRGPRALLVLLALWVLGPPGALFGRHPGALVRAVSIGDLVRAVLQWGKEDLEAEQSAWAYQQERRDERAALPSGASRPARGAGRLPCDTRPGVARSREPPGSVHELRPGDIDVVGSLGDSLIAGNGALEEFAIGTFIEARGVSWAAGGQGDWREYLTLPNILREFNPRLRGYSTGTGEFIGPGARLNVAYPVAATEDALQQARILVARMRRDPLIDLEHHWKMITILFGANDICSAQCFSPKEFSPARHAFHLRRVLDYLRAALPRTIVNLVPAMDVSISKRVPERTMMCRLLHPLYCACMHRGAEPDLEASRISRLYQRAAEALVASGRYDRDPEFTVVLQPFTKAFNGDPARGAPIDKTLVTHDCFHFSRKGHALAANLLWNNLLEPVGNKTERGIPKVLARLRCPSAAAPYIFTRDNSQVFRRTGSQVAPSASQANDVDSARASNPAT